MWYKNYALFVILLWLLCEELLSFVQYIKKSVTWFALAIIIVVDIYQTKNLLNMRFSGKVANDDWIAHAQKRQVDTFLIETLQRCDSTSHGYWPCWSGKSDIVRN